MSDVVYTRMYMGRLRFYRVLSETLTHVYLQNIHHPIDRFNVTHTYLNEYYTKQTGVKVNE